MNSFFPKFLAELSRRNVFRVAATDVRFGSAGDQLSQSRFGPLLKVKQTYSAPGPLHP